MRTPETPEVERPRITKAARLLSRQEEPYDFLDGLRHAADEDENAGHHLQAHYIREAADRIERLWAEVTFWRDGLSAEEVAGNMRILELRNDA